MGINHQHQQPVLDRSPQIAAIPWEPRTKLVSGLFYIFGVITLQDPRLVAAAFCFALFFALWGRLTPLQLIRKLLLLAPFLTMMSIPLLFGGGYPPPPDRIELFLQIILKVLTAMTFTLFIFTNQPIENLLEALEHLKMPGIIATIIYLAYRYGFLIINETQSMLKALKARLFRPKLSVSSLPVYGELAGGLFIKSLNRSETVYRAMAARGFQGRMPIGAPRKIVWTDLIKAAIPVVFVAGLILFGQEVL